MAVRIFTYRRVGAVVVLRKDDVTSLRTYVRCDIVGGTFGDGDGDGLTTVRTAARGTSRRVWLEVDALPTTRRPAWLRERLPRWIADPPVRPDRFNEDHD